MLLLHNTSTDPAFNLALEEYALTGMKEDILILWRNDKAVIVGKNQNAVEEIDSDYLRENGIALIRRQSGGGAVYHDLGNINYTMIRDMGEDDFSNYGKFTKPVCDFLATLGIQAEYQGRNDILVDGMKISGNAQAAKNGRFMHHGTILFDVDFTVLANVLKPRDIKIESKGVKSVRSRVTNLAERLPRSMEPLAFLKALYRFFLDSEPDIRPYNLSKADIAAVRQLVAEKYGTWEWNFGGSPAYNYQRAAKFPCGIVELRLTVHAGIIESATIYGDFFGIREIGGLEKRLCGLRHEPDAVAEALEGFPLGEYISGLTVEELVTLF